MIAFVHKPSGPTRIGKGLDTIQRSSWDDVNLQTKRSENSQSRETPRAPSLRGRGLQSPQNCSPSPRPPQPAHAQPQGRGSRCLRGPFPWLARGCPRRRLTWLKGYCEDRLSWLCFPCRVVAGQEGGTRVECRGGRIVAERRGPCCVGGLGLQAAQEALGRGSSLAAGSEREAWAGSFGGGASSKGLRRGAMEELDGEPTVTVRAPATVLPSRSEDCVCLVIVCLSSSREARGPLPQLTCHSSEVPLVRCSCLGRSGR